MTLLSVVVPCFNEAVVLPLTHPRLVSALDALAVDYEIIYVDDGSSDDTVALIQNFQKNHDAVRYLGLSRNFGHQVAVTAGLQFADGDAVVIIDADLQDPPEVIGAFLQKWREGFDVVYGQRLDRDGETPFKRWTAFGFYRLLNRLSDTPIPLDTGDFRLLDRRLVDILKQMPERHRLLRALVSWLGFRQIAVGYHRAPRAAGTTKYTLQKMCALAIDGLVSFSTMPLRGLFYLGLLSFFGAMLGIGYAVVVRLFTDDWVPGWAFLATVMFAFGGLQLISLGIMGEYLGRIYTEVKSRPYFLIDDWGGFGEAKRRELPPRRRLSDSKRQHAQGQQSGRIETQPDDE